METLLRPMGRRELRLFVLCVLISVGIHLALVLLATGGGEGPGESDEAAVSAIAERYGAAVNRATQLSSGVRSRIDGMLASAAGTAWKREEFGPTVQWLAHDLGLSVEECDVVRAMDADRSREGRWDIRVWLRWDEKRDIADVLQLAYVVGEGTLKSDFGSHRLWLHLEAEDGSGRIALETMDCRLYRADKLTASDLLHRGEWVGP